MEVTQIGIISLVANGTPCLGLGLVISPTKTQVIVVNGPGTASTWRVGAQVLPLSASFKYLGIVFHESGTMSYALQRLAHSVVGACAQLRAKFRGLLCQSFFPMIRRLFDALFCQRCRMVQRLVALVAPQACRLTSRRCLMSR